MKKLLLLSLATFCLNAISAQTSGEEKIDFIMKAGYAKNAWYSHGGLIAGLEINKKVWKGIGWKVASRVGLSREEQVWEDGLDKKPYFLSQFGLSFSTLKGKLRLSAGATHQYLPRPYTDDTGYFFCGTNLSQEQLDLIESDLAKQREAKNMLGGNFAIEWHFKLENRIPLTIGYEQHFFRGRKVFHASGEQIPITGLTLGFKL